MQKQLRSRLHLPVAETLHIAHVLTQTLLGFMTGASDFLGLSHKAWSSHLFRARDGSQCKLVANFFGRLEFQDGKRKRYVNMQEAATQFYHGRGTVHLHCLLWLQNIEAAKLEEVISATVPTDNPPMQELIEGSQRSWTGSGWPKHEGPSGYDAAAGVMRLQHLPSDWCAVNKRGVPEGVRACLPDVLSSLQCHTDVQMSDGRGMLLRYVSGYVPKFSDSFASDWLNDASSDYAVAKRVLTDYHPLEPEMVLQLAMQWFPQCMMGGSMKPFRVPVPWIGDCPVAVAAYMECTWRPDTMTLLEFLRMSNSKGEPHRFVKQLYEAYKTEVDEETEPLPLTEWLVSLKTEGQVLIAAQYLSRYNDRYSGQWLMMNHPFRTMDALKAPGVDCLPDHLFYQGMAYLLRPDHWTNEEAIRAELELEAFQEYHIRNIITMLKANQQMIRLYLNGSLNKNEEVPAAPEDSASKPALSRQQQQYAEEILECVQRGMSEKQAKEEAWTGADVDGSAIFGVSAALRPAIAVLGPAGSGKTTAVHSAVEAVTQVGGRVLITAPTGRLAATMREKFPDIEIDTIHGAFQVFKPVQETLELMWPYDLVIVEEVGQLSKSLFERIMELWEAAERIPALVFVGDFWQLPGVEPTTALNSALWHSVKLKKRELHTMRRCKCDTLRQKLEILRTSKPSVAQLKMIKKGHKAPSRGRAGYVMNPEPSPSDVGFILEETPETMFLTISRKAAAKLNEMAMVALFHDQTPLLTVPCDPDSNPANFDGSAMSRELPLQLDVFLGQRVILTKNLNKSIGFVNGMGAVVLGVLNGNVLVRTDQGRRLLVHPWHSESRVVYFPMRPGYASTLHKVQGATLKHITVWLDVPNMPAAAYVALSRVEYDNNWRFVGDPGIHHFTPARF
jgi:hypothetical protein